MTDHHPLRAWALFGTALLVAGLGGCASATTSAATSATGSAAAAAGTAPAAGAAAAAGAVTPGVGCASVGQANAVTIRQTSHIAKPVTKFSSANTYRQPAQVRALFGQLCAAVTHPSATMLMHCPVDSGTSYLGTFYDGTRALGTFAYAASGCERVSFTAGGKTMATMVYGRTAAAAPHLRADLNVLLGSPGSASAPASPAGP